MKQRSINEILANSHEPSIDGIIVTDAHGVIQAFDNAAQQLFGYQQDDILKQHLSVLILDPQAQDHPIFLAQTSKKRSSCTQKLNFRRTIIGKHKLGNFIPLAITVSADTSAPEIHFTGVLQDLRKHEEHLTQIFQDFETTTEALRERIEFDSLLNEHSNRLLSCSQEEFISAMENALQGIGEFLSFDHCFFLKINNDFNQGSLWAEWRRSISLMKPFPELFDIPSDERFLAAFSKKDTIILSNCKNQNQNQELTAIYKLAQGMSPNGFITTHITPIQGEKKALSGCIGFSILDPNHQPSESQTTLLNVATQLLINAWGRHQLILKSQEAEQNLLSANRVLSQQALHDALTDLPNRRAFDHGLLQEFDRAQRHKSSVCLLMCDIDFFKHYNDYFGHPEGDHCLQQVARIFQRTFHRAGELCTRFGGEEFAVILPSISHDEAEIQAKRLLQNLLYARIPHSPSSNQAYLTMSIGIAEYSQSHRYNDVYELMNAADKALYYAKENGRNQLAWAKEAE